MTLKLLMLVGVAAAATAVSVSSPSVASADPCYLAGAPGDRNPMCGPVDINQLPQGYSPDPYNNPQDQPQVIGQVPKMVVVPGA